MNKLKYQSMGLLTYNRAKELIDKYKHCPYCGRSDGLVAVRIGDYPPGKSGFYWKATTSDEIVCRNCNIVWSLEQSFINSFKEAHDLNDSKHNRGDV